MVVWDTQPHALPRDAPLCMLPPVSLGLSPFLVLGHLNSLWSVPTTDADLTAPPLCAPSLLLISGASIVTVHALFPCPRFKSHHCLSLLGEIRAGVEGKPGLWLSADGTRLFRAPFVNIPMSDFVVHPPLCNQESQRRAFGTGQHTPFSPLCPKPLAAQSKVLGEVWGGDLGRLWRVQLGEWAESKGQWASASVQALAFEMSEHQGCLGRLLA